MSLIKGREDLIILLPNKGYSVSRNTMFPQDSTSFPSAEFILDLSFLNIRQVAEFHSKLAITTLKFAIARLITPPSLTVCSSPANKARHLSKLCASIEFLSRRHITLPVLCKIQRYYELYAKNPCLL